MAHNKQEVANRLLDGLIDRLLATLSPGQLDGLIEQELDYALDVATRYTLNDWVSAEQIRITAQKYAAEMDISGAIPELVGDMVEQFYDHGIQSDRLIGDVVDEDVVMALLDKVLEIPLSRQSMAWLGRNPVLLALLAGGAQLGGTYVWPEDRGRGIATRAVRGLVGTLRSEGLPRVTLHVHEANTPAVRCYVAAGFRPHAPFRLMVL